MGGKSESKSSTNYSTSYQVEDRRASASGEGVVAMEGANVTVQRLDGEVARAAIGTAGAVADRGLQTGTDMLAASLDFATETQAKAYGMAGEQVDKAYRLIEENRTTTDERTSMQLSKMLLLGVSVVALAYAYKES